MKSREDFKDQQAYENYLTCYYAGQICSALIVMGANTMDDCITNSISMSGKMMSELKLRSKTI